MTKHIRQLSAPLALPFAALLALGNCGVFALEFTDAADHDRIHRDDVLVLAGIREAVVAGTEITVHNKTRDENYVMRHRLSPRQVDMLLAGGLIPWLQKRKAGETGERD